MFEAVLQLAEQGWQFVKRRYSSEDFHRFDGSVEDVLRQVVLANWNGRYLSCGIGNHTIVYVRDLSISAESLIRTGFLSEVRQTVNYMMKAFLAAGKVTTTINQHGGAYDTFEYGSDSLPYLMRLLRLTGAYEIVEQNKSFFARAIHRYERLVIDQETGLVRTDRSYSTQKDIHTRRGCAYDNVCLLLLRDELARAREAGLRLPNPFAAFDNLTERFIERFWTGRYFRDTVRGNAYIASDANLFPFFFDIITDREMAHASLAAIQHAGLDSPIPAAYTRVRVRRTENVLMRILSPNYQGNSSWTLLGGLYLTVLAKSHHPDADRVARSFHDLIDRERTCLELYQPDGKPFKTWTYRTDEAMLWSSLIYAQLLDIGLLGEDTVATPAGARQAQTQRTAT